MSTDQASRRPISTYVLALLLAVLLVVVVLTVILFAVPTHNEGHVSPPEIVLTH